MKAEWLSAYIAARWKAFLMNNIHAGQRVAGLLPFHDCCDAPSFNTDEIWPQTPITTSPLEHSVLNSSLSDAMVLYIRNTALLEMIDANEQKNY